MSSSIVRALRSDQVIFNAQSHKIMAVGMGNALRFTEQISAGFSVEHAIARTLPPKWGE